MNWSNRYHLLNAVDVPTMARTLNIFVSLLLLKNCSSYSPPVFILVMQNGQYALGELFKHTEPVVNERQREQKEDGWIL